MDLHQTSARARKVPGNVTSELSVSEGKQGPPHNPYYDQDEDYDMGDPSKVGAAIAVLEPATDGADDAPISRHGDG